LYGKSWHRMKRQSRRLTRDERGVTAIEFALLALPFFGIVGAIMQTSVIFLSSQVLESAVQDAARTIRTGQVQAAGTTIEEFRADICGRLYGLFPDCAGLHIRVNTLADFQSADLQPPLDTDCEAPCDWTVGETWTPGNGKSVTLVQVYYRYPVAIRLGVLGMSNLGDGRRLMGSATVFQNEPFS
jgi:Flp pilus assembly protein TadG